MKSIIVGIAWFLATFVATSALPATLFVTLAITEGYQPETTLLGRYTPVVPLAIIPAVLVGAAVINRRLRTRTSALALGGSVAGLMALVLLVAVEISRP